MAARLKNQIPEEPPFLVTEDWDFSNCPADEQAACRFYEYAREKPSLKRAVAERRVYNDWATHTPPDHPFIFEEEIFVRFFRELDEFPKVPWLRIQEEKRKRLVEYQTRPPISIVNPSRWDLLNFDEDKGGFPFISGSEGGGIQMVYPLEIDWTRSDTRLCEAFEVWITKNRPSPSIAQTGRGQNFTPLVFLGVFRLFRAFQRWEKVVAWISHYGGPNRPFYDSLRAWKEAKAKALRLIRARESEHDEIVLGNQEDPFEMPKVQANPSRLRMLEKMRDIPPGGQVPLTDLIPIDELVALIEQDKSRKG